MNTTPNPPENYRLLTDEEKKLPLPMDTLFLGTMSGEWMDSTRSRVGELAHPDFAYATRITPATPEPIVGEDLRVEVCDLKRQLELSRACERMMCKVVEEIALQCGLDLETAEPPDVVYGVIAMRAERDELKANLARMEESVKGYCAIADRHLQEALKAGHDCSLAQSELARERSAREQAEEERDKWEETAKLYASNSEHHQKEKEGLKAVLLQVQGAIHWHNWHDHKWITDRDSMEAEVSDAVDAALAGGAK